MRVSVILPTYNEAENIVKLVKSVIDSVPPEWQYEIIVVDDNSPDHTYRIVQETFEDDDGVIAVLRTSDRGLGRAIRAGIERSQGDQILVMDSDFTHNPAEIPKMLHVAAVYDIVSGSRFCAGGNMQDKMHYIGSLVYNWLMRLILRTQVQDNLGGFFTIRAINLDRLPFDRIFFGYGDYFFRLLHYAQGLGMTIVEIPAEYRVRVKGKSKSNFLRLLFAYTAALVRLRLAGDVADAAERGQDPGARQ